MVYPLFPYRGAVYCPFFSVFDYFVCRMFRRVKRQFQMRHRDSFRLCVFQHSLHLCNIILKIILDPDDIISLGFPDFEFFPCVSYYLVQEAFFIQITYASIVEWHINLIYITNSVV